jgi:hypothetical protein
LCNTFSQSSGEQLLHDNLDQLLALLSHYGADEHKFVQTALGSLCINLTLLTIRKSASNDALRLLWDKCVSFLNPASDAEQQFRLLQAMGTLLSAHKAIRNQLPVSTLSALRQYESKSSNERNRNAVTLIAQLISAS